MKNGYYIVLFSPHGLIRYKDAEIGKDKDTGGQVKFVLEMLESLSAHPQVRKIDLFTRRIADKRVSTAYQQHIEDVNDKARIVRVTCGGSIYRAKETLWNHLDEFIDKTLRFIEQDHDIPDVVHGHYADGNYLALQISEIFGIPYLATGHSLGRNKQSILLQQGLSQEEIDEKFNMQRRITAEENALKAADAMVVSTQHIIDTQYRQYDNFEEKKFHVIPPGINSELFYPFYRLDMASYKMSIEQEQVLYRINSEIDRFLFNPSKPLILSIGRADKRKNFETIIQAYGQDVELQSISNLAIFAGVRKDITKMPENEQEILTNLLLLMDKYDLYGKMAIPKKNDPRLEVPEIYRVAARKRGVFINATPGENFGLTIVEAAACGLPVVASPTGGPKEIIERCKNGLLIDVEDPIEIADALKKILSDEVRWQKYSSDGIVGADKHYSWSSFAEKYVTLLNNLVTRKSKELVTFTQKAAYGKKLTTATNYLISDLDGTLIDGKITYGLDEIKDWINEHDKTIVFGLASGRNREITAEAIDKYELPPPDVIICSAGSEIYYTDKFIPDKGWESHINYQWKRKELEYELSKFPGIRLQEPAAQWKFKLSYYVNDDFNDDDLANLYSLLDEKKLRAKILITENKFLDFLPIRASKGQAVRYLSYKWKVPLESFITAGNSGNDIDMLTGKVKGIVVGNYSPELEKIRENKSVYFADEKLSKGVLEGINFYLS